MGNLTGKRKRSYTQDDADVPIELPSPCKVTTPVHKKQIHIYIPPCAGLYHYWYGVVQAIMERENNIMYDYPEIYTGLHSISGSGFPLAGLASRYNGDAQACYTSWIDRHAYLLDRRAGGLTNKLVTSNCDIMINNELMGHGYKTPLDNEYLNHFIYISKYNDNGKLISLPYTPNGKYNTAEDYSDALSSSAFMPFVFTTTWSRMTSLHGMAMDGYVGMIKNKISGFSIVRKTAHAANTEDIPIKFLNFGHLTNYNGVIRHLKRKWHWKCFFYIMSTTKGMTNFANFIAISWIRIAGIAGIPFFYSVHDFQWMFDAGYQDGNEIINPVLDCEYGEVATDLCSDHEHKFIPIRRNINLENNGGISDINTLRIDGLRHDEYKMPIKKIVDDLINISIYGFIVYCAYQLY